MIYSKRESLIQIGQEKELNLVKRGFSLKLIILNEGFMPF